MLVAVCYISLVSFAFTLYVGIYYLFCTRRSININYHFAIVKSYKSKRIFKIVMRTKKAYFGKDKKLNTQFFIKNAKNLLFALKPECIYSCNTHSTIIKQLEKHKSIRIISVSPKLLGSSLAVERAALNGTPIIKAIITSCFCKDRIKMFHVVFEKTAFQIK